jgi:hypothetical protein
MVDRGVDRAGGFCAGRGRDLPGPPRAHRLVRGIYPPVLADRGLADAVRALVLDTPLHTELDIDLPGPPAATGGQGSTATGGQGSRAAIGSQGNTADAGGQGRIIETPVGAAVYFAVADLES